MPRILQINSCVAMYSTGRIVEDIGAEILNQGWNSYVAYGRAARLSTSNLTKIGTKFDVLMHGLITRFFDGQGLGSKRATYKFINKLKEIAPDIIHIHNIHDYYINYQLLFECLKISNIPVVWTFHDCWPVTGHCSHFELINCERWKTECHHCPQKREYPASYFLDRSRLNYHQKREFFTSLEKLTIVPVSNWLAEIVKESFLSKFPIRVINNGINLNIFHPENSTINIREKYNLGNKLIILGVGTSWYKDKGLNEFIELSKNTQWQIILIGIPNKIRKQLPSEIISISKTDSQNELASYYSAADVLLNPTYQDTFPTVNLEAMACGTPVITYKTGGSPESLTESTGIVVEKGDIAGIKDAINIMKSKGKSFYSIACRKRAESLYNKDDRYMDYIELYKKLLSNN